MVKLKMVTAFMVMYFTTTRITTWGSL